MEYDLWVILEWFRGKKWPNPRPFIWPGKYGNTARHSPAAGCVGGCGNPSGVVPSGTLDTNLACPMGENRDPIFVHPSQSFTPHTVLPLSPDLLCILWNSRK